MNPVRRGTPESEAVASSEDERPWPSSMSFGKFPMNENSVPGLPGGIWSTQKRGSFKLSETAQHNAARETRLAAINTSNAALRGTPSPASAVDGAGSLPFSIPLQPTSKTGRSLSHSQGQREVSISASQHIPSTGEGQRAALPLGLLAEEVDTESDSELDNSLSHTTSHPPIGSLTRTATLPAAYAFRSVGNSLDNPDDHSPGSRSGLTRVRTLESAFANLAIENTRQRAQWQSHLGWDDVVNVNESRRHSLADMPTRRGSLAAGEPSHLSRAFTMEAGIEDEHPQFQRFGSNRMMGTQRDSQVAHLQQAANLIPAMYVTPQVELSPRERSEMESSRDPENAQWGVQAHGRPRKQLYVVSFKCSRVDVFYLLDNTGLLVREGDMVIVEADRGQDLGTVQHAKVTPDTARLLKKKYSEEQYKWLMMYSRNKEGGINPNAQFHADRDNYNGNLFPDAPSTMQGTIPRDTYSNLKPKAIKRLANDHEIKMLAEKEGNEAKAKRACQQKVTHLRLQMEILDAEWQWDFQKLIFYYYADHYINFKDLITELYRIYKTRIWLSAINPASFSQHAVGQPPSGIGPGAVHPFNPYAVNNNYIMAYGEDRDPYGAQMPYRIPYETYTPNYPAIPGVANSFAPGPSAAYASGQNFTFYGPSVASDQGNVVSSPQAGDDATPTNDHRVRASHAFDNNNLFAGNDEHHGFVPNSNAMPPSISLPHNRASMSRPESFNNAYDQTYPPAYNAAMANLADAPSNSWDFTTARAPNPDMLGRQAPIGTARPMSHGSELGSAATGLQFNSVNVRTRPVRGNTGDRSSPSPFSQPSGTTNLHGSSNSNSNGGAHRASVSGSLDQQVPVISNPSRNTRGKSDHDEATDRLGTMSRFYQQLPSSTKTRADEMSRER